MKMAKRMHEFNDRCYKKPKTEIDDLWGDDFDIQDVDECIQLASQIYEQDIICTQQNVSIVPSYTGFKQQTKRAFTSTQSNPELTLSFNNPTTSNNIVRKTNENNYNDLNNGIKRSYGLETNTKVTDVECKLRKVQDQFYAKEGEVTILRSQLKEIQVQNDREHMKTVKEWSEKYETVSKQLTAVKSELEFKNYEIVNLKQQVTEKIKVVNRDTSICFTQSSIIRNKEDKYTQQFNETIKTRPAPKSNKQNDINQDFKIFYTIENDFPLQNLIEPSIFHPPSEEKYLTDIKNSRMYGNRIPLLSNQLSQGTTERLIHLQPKRTFLPNDRELNIDYIQSDIYNLMKCTSYELEMPTSYAYINKIVCTSEQLCDNLYKYFVELEKSFGSNNDEMVEMLHLKSNFDTMNRTSSLFSPDDWLDSEMGKSARQSIACIAHILYNSSYLRKYLLENKRLIFKGQEDYLEHFPIAREKLENDYINNYDYLNLLLSIVSISGKLKYPNSISGVLSAICLLLSKIYSCKLTFNIHPLLTELIHEVVFVCPNVQVLCYLSECFTSAVLHQEFVTALCKMGLKGSLKIEQKEKIVYCKKEVCPLQVFCVLVGYSFSNEKRDSVFHLYTLVLMFIKNCFKIKLKWMHYQENKHCDCLCKIVKLGINILYQSVEEFKNSYPMVTSRRKCVYNTDKLSKYAELLRNGIELLEVLKYKVYNIVINYLITHSEYKVIIKSLMSLKDELNLTEAHVERLQDLVDVEETSIMETDELTKSLWD